MESLPPMEPDMIGEGFSELFELAEALLSDLCPFTFAEGRLLDAVATGDPADGSDDSGDMDPANAQAWSPARTIRAEILRWLCVDPEARERVTEKGINLTGARIVGPLNLAQAVLPFPLRFARCAMEHGLQLSAAELPLLTLIRCVTGPVRGDRLSIHGPLSISDGCRVMGGVRLTDGIIIGDLDLSGLEVINGGAVALAGTGLSVAGDLYMGGGFRSLGAVRLIGATVSGNLDMRGARLLNRGAVALACDSIQVGGDALLHKGFRAYGKVRLMGARVLGRVRGKAITRDGRAPS